MANDRSRAIRGEEVELSIQYYGIDGLPQDADATPYIEIQDFNGNIIVSSTTVGVERAGVGLYIYTYDVSASADKGMWKDTWIANLGGVSLTYDFTFLVADETSATVGTIQLGDDVIFDYSQEELATINLLLKYLKQRLRSTGLKPSRDQFGAFVYDGYGEMVMEQCNVFDDEILVSFLNMSLAEFNMIPFFTSYSFADDIIRTLFPTAIVEGAYIFAIASQALIEKGRDFTISDGGISYQPPQLGEFLQSHYSTWLTSYREQLKFIKNSIRPGPKGFGTYSNLASGSPAFTRLRSLRARQIY